MFAFKSKHASLLIFKKLQLWKDVDREACEMVVNWALNNMP